MNSNLVFNIEFLNSWTRAISFELSVQAIIWDLFFLRTHLI